MMKKRYNKTSGIVLITIFSFIALNSGAQEKLEMAALNRVTINHGDTLYQFYAVKIPQKKKFDEEKTYYWFVKDTILVTQSGHDGKLLHGKFHVFYPNKNLMEEGQFKYGLKTGLWKSWHPNGLLRQTVNWMNGSINGNFEEFDQTGRKIRSGSYKNNLFTGHVMVYLQNGGSQRIYYQNGKIVIEKANVEKPKQTNDKKL